MKFINIIIITLTLILSHNVLATGSDGGNSQPGANPPVQPPVNHQNNLVEFCFIVEETGEEICILVNRNSNLD